MTSQADRVAELSTDTGTGALQLAGPAIGYRSFSAAFGAGGDTEVYYGVIQDGTGEWETGIGTYEGPVDMLRRDQPLEGSAGRGQAVNFPAGDKVVYVTFPAESTLTLRSRRPTDVPLVLRGAPGHGPLLQIYGDLGFLFSVNSNGGLYPAGHLNLNLGQSVRWNLNAGITVDTGNVLRVGSAFFADRRLGGGAWTVESRLDVSTVGHTDPQASLIIFGSGSQNIQFRTGGPGAANDAHVQAAASAPGANTLMTLTKGDARWITADAASVGAAIAGMTHTSVGAWAFMVMSGSATATQGTNVAGSNLNFSSGQGNSGTSPGGTWKCMGNINQTSGTLARATVFLRIA